MTGAILSTASAPAGDGGGAGAVWGGTAEAEWWEGAAIWWRLRHGRRRFTSGKQHFRCGPLGGQGAAGAGGKGPEAA